MPLLVLEDDPDIAAHLESGLTEAGFQVVSCGAGDQALALALTSPFEALVVDVHVPGLSGLDVVRRLREVGRQTPVLFLTARDRMEDRILGLEEGGDDYVVKPYSLPEVVARLRAIIRRTKPLEAYTRMVEVGDLVWEPALRRISRAGQKIELTPKEYALAVLLLEHRGAVVSRSQIVRAVWGMPTVTDPNAVDVQIRRLRRKLDDPFPLKLIHTVRGLGVVLGIHE
ncbi:MAG TPA: response regulator transcription factor [Holophagaceae bacterium]|nr:response regulator transcription factor [Holophagaceae bacterium]